LEADCSAIQRSVFFVPDDVLLRAEASALGIRGPDDLYGGVAPHPFVNLRRKVRDVTLPGYTVFNAGNAGVAA
jgi:Protein of unknown function (DUF3182)